MKIGIEIHNLAKQLWNINRSITGEGVRQTFEVIAEHIPKIKIHSVNSGTKVFDWVVPKEWHVNEAYIITPAGERICDFANNNLHLVGYSIPFNKTIPLSERLKFYIEHLIEKGYTPEDAKELASFLEEEKLKYLTTVKDMATPDFFLT